MCFITFIAFLFTSSFGNSPGEGVLFHNYNCHIPPHPPAPHCVHCKPYHYLCTLLTFSQWFDSIRFWSYHRIWQICVIIFSRVLYLQYQIFFSFGHFLICFFGKMGEYELLLAVVPDLYFVHISSAFWVSFFFFFQKKKPYQTRSIKEVFFW